jgi:hypothetical protein
MSNINSLKGGGRNFSQWLFLTIFFFLLIQFGDAVTSPSPLITSKINGEPGCGDNYYQRLFFALFGSTVREGLPLPFFIYSIVKF